MSDSASLEKGTRPSSIPSVFHANRTAVKLGGVALFSLAFQALGVIYSDIGTSPLYVLNGIWPASGPLPSEEDVIGGVSAIIWSLTLLPLCKYIFTSLSFGTEEGEGGTFALFQGLYPRAEKDYDADRTLTGESIAAPFNRETEGRHITPKLRWPLLIVGLLGTSLTMADGILTPAVSVTSAVAGIAIAKPSVTDNLQPISIAILLVLFFFQRFGTERVAFTFAPISFIWLSLLAGTGIYNITTHPGIFRAFDPSRAILLFVRTRNYDILAGVLLAITGCEAIFANLGQFNAMSIRLSFCFVTYPAIVLAYLGQGARLIADGEAVFSNMFYNTIPGKANGPLFWIVFIFAILATVVASQAMITATFSLVQQLINTKSFPPIRMLHTSDKIQGQIYIPAANWLLMIGSIILVGAFKDLTKLTNAYGFAVATVMFTTSVLIAVHIYYRKQLLLILAIAYFIPFGFFDALFWGASLKKVPLGAWVPLMIGLILLGIMTLWTWGKSLEDKFDGANRQNLRHFIQQDEGSSVIFSPQPNTQDVTLLQDDASVSESDPQLYYVSGGKSASEDGEMELERKRLQRIPSCAIFHKITEGKGIPHTFIGFIRQWPALPRVVVFLSVCIVPIARVPENERYVVNKVRTVEGFYGATYYIGFRDDFDVKVHDLVEKIILAELRINPTLNPAIVEEIKDAATTATHIAPHYHVVSRNLRAGKASIVVNWIRQFFIEDVYRRLATMFPETGKWLTSADEIIHVGINATI